MLARDRQIPALRGEISAENGDLAIPFEQTGYPLNAYPRFKTSQGPDQYLVRNHPELVEGGFRAGFPVPKPQKSSFDRLRMTFASVETGGIFLKFPRTQVSADEH
jgi:hypothetical protein